MMSKTVIPHGYKPLLDLYQTQTAIGCLKRNFEQKLCAALNLKRVSAPLFVEPSTGLNDDLNGVERPVSFDLKETGRTAQVVHSLAKWKRMALYKYGFAAGEGLYTDMNAIRRDEKMDNLHSVYVDQWDWEKVITPADRTTAYLQSTVRAIYAAVSGTLDELKALYPQLTLMLPAEVGSERRPAVLERRARLCVRGVLYGHPRGPSGAGRATHRSGLRRPPDADVPQAAACG